MSKNTINIKKQKVVDGFSNLDYQITQWFIDSVRGNCIWFVVRSNVNYIEFLCTVPPTLHLVVDSGTYVQETPATEDLQNLTSMWNECDLQNLFIKTSSKFIIKTGNSYIVYEPSTSKLSEIDEYINTADLEASGSEPNIIMENKNPFDMLMMGEQIPKTTHNRVEIQPCVLVDYEGYSLGQAIPVRNFVDFFNKKQVGENSTLLCEDVKKILDFQGLYIDKLYKSAISTLEDFLKTVQKNYSDLQKNSTDNLNQYKKLQSIILSNKSGIRENAVGILHELLKKQTLQYTETVEFLQFVESAFSRV